MEEIKRQAYAKINLGLDVIKRRQDGYHEVKMIMQTVDLYDVLTFHKEQKPGINILVGDAKLPTNEKNLVYKVAALLIKQFAIKEGITITLEKNIPISAGMAGGSTDAAAVFHGLNQLFDLKMTVATMCEYGVKIGADVPYCIMGGTALSEGIGERLTQLQNPLECYLVIAKPDCSISTKFVYENLHANQLTYHPDIDGMIVAIESGDLKGVTDRMGNVLETVTIKKYPIIEEIKEQMKKLGAVNALMSGSGPTVFGIWKNKEQAKEAYDTLRKRNIARQIFLTKFQKGGCFNGGKSVTN